MVTLKNGGLVIGDGEVRICAPVSPRNGPELAEELKFVDESGCDLVEWRYDYWAGGGGIAGLLVDAKAKTVKPLIFTYRTMTEGGFGLNGENEYFALNEKAILSGHADIIDIEFTKGRALTGELMRLARENGVKTILSRHIFEAGFTKAELTGMLLQMRENGGDIIKLAVMADDENDALEVIDAAREASEKSPKTPFVTIGMGDAGKATRRVKPFYGSSMTYAKGMRETAPGQMSVDELRLFQADKA